jgi:NAD(P)-dependent dehydrogenase (short-subunit alcohol dehydrogenase family)
VSGQRLAGRRALVTGAARGIGRAYAERFVAEGARVAIVDVDGEAARKTASEIGSEAIAVVADVSDEAAVERAVAEVDAAFDGFDIVVNNAAIVVGTGTPYDPSVANLRMFVDVNLLSVWLMTRAAAPVLARSEHARIINICSTAAYNFTNPRPDENIFPGRRGFNYAFTKYGVRGLTKLSAGQLGRWGITVNALAPGPTHTDTLLAEMEPEDLARIVDSQAIKGALMPEDMAGVAVFFASDDARYVTGQDIVVDGGRFMGV